MEALLGYFLTAPRAPEVIAQPCLSQTPHTKVGRSGVCQGDMKSKFAAVAVFLIVVGSLVVLRLASQHWIPAPAPAASPALQAPDQDKWSASMTLTTAPTNSASTTNAPAVAK
jgi:hypothetical protein